MRDADVNEYTLLSTLPNSLHQRIMFLSVCAVTMEGKKDKKEGTIKKMH